jgi:hypothetical protein
MIFSDAAISGGYGSIADHEGAIFGTPSSE